MDYIRTILKNYYPDGLVSNIRHLDKGQMNVSYLVELRIPGQYKRCILRLYRSGISEERIEYEHALVDELCRRGFDYTSKIVKTRQGSSYVPVSFEDLAADHLRYYCLFTFLEGEDKYEWDTPYCSSDELTSAAELLALYHTAIHDWNDDCGFQEPSILDNVANIPERWSKYATREDQTEFDHDFKNSFNQLLCIQSCLLEIIKNKPLARLPLLPIHGDYHPGNLKYQNGRAAAMFDFDWANRDFRCLDLALAMVYFCAVWQGQDDGALKPDKMDLFLRGYQETARTGTAPGPLNVWELDILPDMIQAANLYVLDWTLGYYYEDRADPDLCLKYLRHHLKLIRWCHRYLNQHWEPLARICRGLEPRHQDRRRSYSAR